MKELSAKRLDPAVPDKPLGEWLHELLGEGVTVCWQVNDCGEQTGDPAVDQERDIPLCVEAWAAETSLGRVSVTVTVGSHRRGVQGTRRLRGVLVGNEEGVRRLRKRW